MSRNAQTSPGIRVGLTGGIACGKSEVKRILATLDVAVLDTDDVARASMQPGQDVFAAVVDAFGDGILAADGTIDRGVLGDRVFSNETERETLNRLVHPAVRRQWRAWQRERDAEGAATVVVIPLLFESGFTDGWTAIVCVAAGDDRVRDRLRRRGLTDEQARQRIAAQWPLEKKMEQSDYVIRNDGTLDELHARVVDTWGRIIEKE